MTRVLQQAHTAPPRLRGAGRPRSTKCWRRRVDDAGPLALRLVLPRRVRGLLALANASRLARPGGRYAARYSGPGGLRALPRRGNPRRARVRTLAVDRSGRDPGPGERTGA